MPFSVESESIVRRLDELMSRDSKLYSDISELKTELAEIDGGRKVIGWIVGLGTISLISFGVYIVQTSQQTREELRSISERLVSHTHPEIQQLQINVQKLSTEMQEARESIDDKLQDVTDSIRQMRRRKP